MNNKYMDSDLKLLKEIYPNNYEEQLNKLESGYPIQYLIGYVNFFGYKVLVNEKVLIPRFETEYLVNDLIKLIRKHNLVPNIIDICSGSGCISIALARELNVRIDALDISKQAIELAKKSAIINNADINFINADIKKYNVTKKYNIIISNPPYVKEDEIVSPEVKYEPSIALYAKEDGLEYYKVILEKSNSILEDTNIIAFEIGANQGKDVKNIAQHYYPNAEIIIKKDLNKIDRYVYILNI